MNQYKIITSANWLPKYRRVNIQHSLPIYKLPSITPLQAKKVAKVDSGEDAFFLNSTVKNQYLGIADGVGSWEKVGIDPSQFSWSLMNHASEIIQQNRTSFGNEMELSSLELLQQAYNRLLKNKEKIVGSSTASILKINKDNGRLNGVNLGDSSFLIIRNRSEIIYKSQEQQHFFNCPYQLSIIPKEYQLNQGYIKNEPSDCNQIELELKENDLIILATDGYFDNVFDEETINIIQNEFLQFQIDHNTHTYSSVNETTKQLINIKNSDWLQLKIRKLSNKLAETARKYSLNPKRLSPWSNSLLKYHQYLELGGKLDDITVLVALVQKNE
ncbi:protein serine/threonine phosphatase 2C [Neoconidiobolus thromboides FSU 785]|nr:protein serine/threonine phosphatase 2C [Neoconidiobolus thromboides FSU 785]